ncbi:hypothetical protein K458DRAFT_417439 [Lentithecium fluviatile CBS 122367]|uniref:Uncharacterized protein n=1 Tax=Lentithecium fluviatile CBS 122367 TaxID=1168545 RepID=A0A6G1J4C4_9PLEO|nr:hypothetical protein K458DRAFT_417439 [Lentithecium fluviatile CBS 122367]
MAPNDDSDRPEDNPFIAFRRFADAQVSAIINTVFTWPNTVPKVENRHVAAEHCILGTADKAQCEKLLELSTRINKLQREGRRLHQAGDQQQMLEKGEELMQLDRQAEALRQDIVDGVRETEADKRILLGRAFAEFPNELTNELIRLRDGGLDGSKRSDAPKKQVRIEFGDDAQTKQNELVERVANEKGQQWAWSWDWSFPRPFDHNDNTTEDATSSGRRCRRWHSRREDRQEQMEDRWDRFNRRMAELDRHLERFPGDSERPRRWWNISVGLPRPAQPPQPVTKDDIDVAQTTSRLSTVFDQVGDAIAEEVPRIFESPRYSPGVLEASKDLKRAGVDWRDAFEDLIRAEHGAPLIPADHLGAYQDASYDRWARRFNDPSYARAEFAQWVTASRGPPVDPNRNQRHSSGEGEEPSYEYGHDHEDQHDDPPTPKAKQGKWSDGMPETELDAYERLLGRPHAPGAATKEEGRPSVLSTLTTTERTVAPDGTVTTKVVLKKRFADGREESSETVHTQRGQETEAQQQDPWKAMQDAQSPPQQDTSRENKKKGSWFWSG